MFKSVTDEPWLTVFVDLVQEEQFKLKQELAGLAIELNMEAQKGHTQEDTYQRQIILS